MKTSIFITWACRLIGLLAIIFAGVLLFVETELQLAKTDLGIIAVAGLLLMVAPKRLIDFFFKKSGDRPKK